jgi:geranylgeranyl pyrophosphate synthase
LIDNTFFEPVQGLIHQVEERMRSQSDGHHPELNSALQHLLASGGKRIRPAITLLTGGMLGADKDRLITLAAAIELLHTATLVHDDLIDGSLFRRGMPTLNARWSLAATVLTGDYIFARAANLAAETNSVPVMRLFAENLATIVNGEITQLFANHNLVSREDYFRRIYAKTASLFETATTSAALISSVDKNITEKVRNFGYQIGMAFQIIDDVLDFTGEQATVGKPLASDLRQGLVTLPALYYVETYPEDQDMKTILDSSICDEECMARLLTSIRQSGAIQQALNIARQYVDRGLDSLKGLPDCQERHALEKLALYIVHRPL